LRFYGGITDYGGIIMASKMEGKLKEQIENTQAKMEEIMEDTAVPRNIRKAIEEAMQRISCDNNLDVNISTAIYLMQDISNDINMPAHTRTEIWQIISELEAIREKCKG
jgi:hypothetical protein